MSGSSYYCFTHTNISTCTQLVEKLKDLSEGALTNTTSGSKGTFSSVQGLPIAECVVSDSHLAFLLEDGRVCRVRYNEEQPAGTSSKEKSEVDDDVASTSSARSLGSRSASPRPEGGEDRSSASVIHAWGSLLGSNSQPGGGASGPSVGVVRLERLAGRGRIQLLRRRGSSRGIMGRWPFMPPSEVPDELVEQAMAVLQGKSRESVIRELQRTSLDVNQAVNNLLGRDDDEGEGSHEEGIAGFLPSGEELLSLLGSGLESVSGEELEDALGRGRGEEGGGRESRVALYDFGEPIPLSEIRSLVSLGDGAAGGRGVAVGEGARRRKRKRKESNSSPMLFDNELEWWMGEKDCRRFKHIVGLHSELLAVDTDGRLCGWAWRSPRPTPRPHPLESELGLTNEKIRLIAGKHLRASVVTESGKIATCCDMAVRSVASSLQQPAQVFPELAGEGVAQLHTCELFSLVLTESKKLFWWGILPFAERKQAIVEAQDRIRSAKYSSSSLSQLSAITPGIRVCLRSSPVYTVGTKAMHIKKGDVQCGSLLESVFSSSLSEKCHFQVLSPAPPAEEGMEMGEGDGGAEPEGARLGQKRKLSEGPPAPREEVWSLRDVVFTEGCRGAQVGVVVKVDGSLVAVRFPSPGREGEEGAGPGGEGTEALADCRLLRRDDLILASETVSQNAPHFCQETPKRLRLPPCHQLLALACDARGVHALFSAHFLLRLAQYELTSGLLSQKSQLGEVVSRYLLRQGAPLRLIPLSISLWLVMDGGGGLYPLTKDNAGAVKDPPMLNLPPITSVGVGVSSGRSNLVVLGFRHQQLMPVILRCDLLSLRGHLDVVKGNPAVLSTLLSEHCSGGCNILHVLAVLGRPPDPPASQGEKRGGGSRPASRSGVLREIMRQAVALASGSAPPSSVDTPLWPEDDHSEDGFELPTTADAVSCLDYLVALPEARESLRALLPERNMEGYTPFMAATACKSYAAAQRLLDVAESLASGSEEALLAMLHPADSHPDDNPVFVLCRNDTCSFTWTGEEHIQQDIFECQTCGLIGSLCCCTECAYICHRGHNCSFKRSSPTAYCDCWERCRCKALGPGSESQRQALLLRLLKRTPLGTKTNARKEHLLGMLIGMVTRQSKEQSHWHALRSSTSYRPRSKNDEMPAHDLAPPKFAQKALNIVLEDWACVKAALLSGSGDGGGGAEAPLAAQSSTMALDALVHTLLSKLSQETLDALLTTLVKHVGPSRSNPEALGVSERFLRSVVRVFTTCQIESLSIPAPSLSTTGSRRKSSVSSVLQERAERVFSSLAPLAVRQLVPMVRAIIQPVRTGMVRPVDPMCMSDRHKTADELFRLPIPSLLRVPSTEDGEQTGHGEGAASDTESEAGDGEESTSGGPAHDASSTATVGSNPIYLSDQDSSEADDLDSGGEEASMDGDNRHEDDIIMEHAPAHRLPPSSSHWALPFSRTTHSSSSTRLSRTSGHRHFRSLSSHSHRGCLSMGVSSALLAKTFSLLLRQLTGVLEGVRALVGVPTPPSTLPIMASDPQELVEFVWAELQEVWAWLVGCMDVVECQVRLGNATERRVTTTDPSYRPVSMASTEILESRRDFLSYLLTLMRGRHREHGGALPAIDVASLEHLAWCLDGVIYLLQHTTPLPPSQPMDTVEGPAPITNTKTRAFFRRSSSVACLGSIPNSPFDPLAEALPLAEKPHLLEPDQCREALFGFELSPCLECWPTSPLPPPPILPLIQHPPSRGEAPWTKMATTKTADCSLTEDQVCGLNSHQLAASVLLGRWNCTIELFGRVFADTVGRSRGSYLADEKQFEMREREFRREMDAIRSSSHREVVIEVERARERLLPGLFNQLNSFCDAWQLGGTSNPPLCVYRVKVSFQGEQGEGSGLLRSLFTAVSEGVLSDEPLPHLELPPPRRPMSPLGKGRMVIRERQRARNGGQVIEKPSSDRTPELLQDTAKARQPLFYQPGKPGFYSPRLGSNSPERLNAYRNLGRVIGLCLLHCEILPMPLCRHVLKYLLHREVSWHDLAFFDSVMYESLRKLILESRGPDGSEHLANLGLSFHVNLRPEEGGGAWDLLPGGALCPVTPENVYEYVQKYAELRMVRVNEEALQHMRDGVNDVLPETVLSGLSPEDLRLLLCGCPHIDIDVLKGITVFNDEYRKGQESVTRLKGWFWSIVERMSQKERQELLYFWTSSPSLPANVDSYQPPPSVMIRPPDDQRLPTANTCISRLYIPLYSSKSLVKLRLLTAVKTKTFGFL